MLHVILEKNDSPLSLRRLCSRFSFLIFLIICFYFLLLFDILYLLTIIQDISASLNPQLISS